jgi:hypothetical protein
MFGTYERLNVHVMASNIAVIRAARLKLKPEFLSRKGRRGQIARIACKAFYRNMLQYHVEARELYFAVTRGNV